jgi:hypothetical protein
MEDAEREEQYAYRTATVRAGNDKRKLVPGLERLARWYEATGRTTQARYLHQQAYSIASILTPHQDSAAVKALRGVARTYVLEYQDGPEVVEAPPTPGEASMSVTSPGQMPSSLSAANTSYILVAEGERALNLAATIARSAELPPEETAGLLIDLADWYLLTDRPDKAATLLGDAERLIAAVSPKISAEDSPLSQPELLLYRAPPSAQRHKNRAAAEVDEKIVVLGYTVTAAGRVADLKFLEGDLASNQRESLLGAFSKAVFRPRIVDGKPVDAPNQRFRQSYRTLKKSDGE